MGNVVPFRARRQTRQATSDAVPAEPRRCRLCSFLGWSIGALLSVVCFAVFLTLLTMRRPVQFLLGLGTVGGMLGLLMVAVGFAGHDKSHLLWMTGIITAVCASVSWFYDMLLLRLSPTPIILT